jgi:hypothetical protein
VVDSTAVDYLTVVTIANRAPEGSLALLCVGQESAWIDLTATYGPGGICRISPNHPSILVPVPPSGAAFTIPGALKGHTVYLQALVFDPGARGGVAFTDQLVFHPRREVNRRADSMPLAIHYTGAVHDELSGQTFVLGGSVQGNSIQVDYGPMIITMDFRLPLGQEFRVSEEMLPRAVSLAALSHDKARRVAWLFGGRTAYGVSDQIVRVELSRPEGERVEDQTDRLPMPLAGAAAAFDPSTGITYIFGGTGHDEIVAYNPQAPAGSRVQVLPDRLPEPWDMGVAAWDERTGRGYLFGGPDPEVIEFDPRRPVGARVVTLNYDRLPSVRRFPAAARDPRDGKIYIVGGTTGVNLDEIVAFDATAPAGGRVAVVDHLASGRYGSFAVYDPSLQMIVVGGGINVQRLRELVGYDSMLPFGARVQNSFSLPTGLLPGAAVFDGTRGEAFLFGGFGPNGYQSTILRVSPRAQGRNKVLLLPDTLPSPRSQTSATWNPSTGHATIFGGLTPQGPTAQIVRFDASAPQWSRVQVESDTLPVPLSGPATVWDPVRRVTWIFGGRTSQQDTDLVAQYDPARPAGSRLIVTGDHLPAPLSLATAVWDPIAQVAYVMGGRGSDVVLFNPSLPEGSRATLLADRFPSSRTMLGVVYDTGRDAFNLFGGFTSYYTDEIIRFSPRGQQRMVVESSLSPGRYGTVAVHDPATATTLVFGGQNDTALNEIWIYQHR